MMQPQTLTEVTFEVDATLPARFRSLREYVQFSLHLQPRPAKSIAADMDLSPSALSRKVSPGDGDTARFTVDDLERYMAVTGDTSPVDYLAGKYKTAVGVMTHAQRVARIKVLLAEVSLLATAQAGA